jgi:hypothetical protein
LSPEQGHFFARCSSAPVVVTVTETGLVVSCILCFQVLLPEPVADDEAVSTLLPIKMCVFFGCSVSC